MLPEEGEFQVYRVSGVFVVRFLWIWRAGKEGREKVSVGWERRRRAKVW